MSKLPGACPLEEHVEGPARDDPVAEEVSDPGLLGVALGIFPATLVLELIGLRCEVPVRKIPPVASGYIPVIYYFSVMIL